ncbi:hypothetical protein AB0I27_06700 [Streptomyces sp. NPDC050597]|uniref:DUF7426 family protein n=1 Tax=Streptomyces sp. NPDC050597 TaxID=3157212 RepID=UPI003435EA26
MAFEALSDYLDDSLTLPVGGRTYRIEAPSAETGLRVQAVMQAAAVAAEGGQPDREVLDDAAELDLFRAVLGDAYDQLLADGVNWPTLKHVARTALAWIMYDREAAETLWSGGGKAPAPVNRADRRARSGAANSTRNPDSSSGTSTHRARPARRKGGGRG